jgi:hypothetical protein
MRVIWTRLRASAVMREIRVGGNSGTTVMALGELVVVEAA